MSGKKFVQYIGDYRVHDAVIKEVWHRADVATVVLQSIEDEIVIIEFHHVKEIRDIDAIGMMLYSISEMSGEEPYRHFVFTNWSECSTASLEVIAKEYRYFHD